MSTDSMTLEEPKADLATENARLREALTKINTIRNSIIGLQTMNWSEHIYPLVAALEDAGITGMSYTEARGMFGTMLERTNVAEDRVEALEAVLDEVRAELKGHGDFPNTIAKISAALPTPSPRKMEMKITDAMVETAQTAAMEFCHTEPDGEITRAMIAAVAPLIAADLVAENEAQARLNGMGAERELALMAKLERLQRTARAVIAQWDTPNWKLTEPTAKLIEAMRAALPHP